MKKLVGISLVIVASVGPCTTMLNWSWKVKWAKAQRYACASPLTNHEINMPSLSSDRRLGFAVRDA